MSINDDMINMAYLRGMQMPQQTATELQRLLDLTRTSEREGWRYADELEQERKRLEAELAALRADADRMDWMQKHLVSLDVEPTVDERVRIVLYPNSASMHTTYYAGEDYRAAIDAARKEAL